MIKPDMLISSGVDSANNWFGMENGILTVIVTIPIPSVLAAFAILTLFLFSIR
ncbi:hypothetical protein QFZ28_001383 [Neobacillus niacini]|uniref:hypothetical protein n=1 Tax=Neobacillus niacini TaxID=86668 RepID=UPI0027837E19|nr:hypothetical protein [Neobacillus niacini]MDQ1000983.1 hypothetical protein [Neobacillus niacini]